MSRFLLNLRGVYEKQEEQNVSRFERLSTLSFHIPLIILGNLGESLMTIVDEDVVYVELPKEDATRSVNDEEGGETEGTSRNSEEVR